MSRATTFAALLLLAVSATCLGGCVHTMRTEIPRGDDDDHRSEVTVSWFWGAVPGVVSAPDRRCEFGLAWVQLERHFGDYLLSVVSLGIVNTATVEYSCAQP